jgi:hypothetical protein
MTPSEALSEKHARRLADESAIAPDVIAESEACSIMRGSDLPDVFSERQRRRAPGILFVSHRPGGSTSWCFRPDRVDPDNPGHKYEQPAKALGGAGNVLDILPSQHPLITEKSVPVIFVEGTKKMLSLVSALRATKERALVVSIVGCWNWLHDGGKPIADIKEIPLEGRKATVMYDSDMLRKIEVQDAARRLAEYLEGRGAATYVTYFEDNPDGSKVGADDFFAAGGTFAQLRLLTRRYDARDFARVRLGRDATLRYMLEDLHESYQRMPTSKQGECSDRATMRYLIERASSGTTNEDPQGVVVRAPVRRMSLSTRMSRQAQSGSLKRLERDGYLEPIEEPKGKIEKRGRAYLLYASCTERTLRGHLRREGGTGQHNTQQNADTYADSYAGVHVTCAPSEATQEMPELRAPKVIHTWGRRDGRRVVLYSNYFYRLSKTRQEVVMYLLDAGGAASEEELLERFGSKSTVMRNFRRRKLSPLMGFRYTKDKQTGQEMRVELGPPIIERADDGTISVLPQWREALEAHRLSTDEDGDTKRQAKKYREQSKNYRQRDKAPADEQPNDLHGKERVRRNVREREREERERWAEEQRRKVGETPTTFLSEEMADVLYVRFGDALSRWQRRGGRQVDLTRAVRAGPYVFRKAAGGLYVEHADGRTEDAYDRKVRAPTAKLRRMAGA